MKCRQMRRTLVTPAAMAALPSLSPLLPPCVFIVFLTRVKVKDCAKKPNELHGRGTKTQFQFQFRFQFGFRASPFPILTLICKNALGKEVCLILCVCVLNFQAGAPQQGKNNVVVAVVQPSRQQLHLTLTCDKFRNN